MSCSSIPENTSPFGRSPFQRRKHPTVIWLTVRQVWVDFEIFFRKKRVSRDPRSLLRTDWSPRCSLRRYSRRKEVYWTVMGLIRLEGFLCVFIRVHYERTSVSIQRSPIESDLRYFNSGNKIQKDIVPGGLMDFVSSHSHRERKISGTSDTGVHWDEIYGDEWTSS